MRRNFLLIAGLLLLGSAGASRADSSGRLTIRRAPSAVAARKGAPAKTSVSPATSEYQSMMRNRVQRWKSFHDLQSSPMVDWSPRANRRVGWKPPATPLRNPHEREATTFGRSAAAARNEVASGPPDTIRVAFIRIDFLNDREGSQTTGDGKFDVTGPDTTIAPIDRPPHNRNFYQQHLEALRRYYDAESYGRVVVVGDVWPRTPNGAYSCNDMADFGPWKFSQEIYRQAVTMFRTMFFAADSQSTRMQDRIPWDSYDRFMVIHAGSDFQSDLRQDSPLDIPSFTVGLSDTDVVIFPDSTINPITGKPRAIDRASFVPETANQDGFYGALNGVIAHENGHNFFGFADIYDIESGFPVVGLWSLMDSGNLAGSQVGLPNGDIIYATGLLPPSVDPFQRFFIGDALHFVEPAWSETTKVRDVERHPDVKRVFLTSDEYLLLENRAIAAPDTIALDQDSTTRVILGPKSPDRYEYDALLPGPGILVWHIDASVIPFYTSFRVSPDYGFNSNPGRPGMSIVEADGLGDLGDPGSPFILGSPLDPFFLSNCPVLADSTIPPLTTHIGTRPHLRFDFLDDPDSTMRFIARRLWLKNGWPVAGDFPAGGPQLLAVDADGDRTLEVCWAGGASGSRDSTALFAVRFDGKGINDSTAVFARLNRPPRPLMAALPIGEPGPPGQPSRGPSYFAVSTYADGPDTSTAGGRVYLLDHHGNALPGWPALLPTIVTTPPVIAGGYPNATVYVGGADGRVYAIALDGTFRYSSLGNPPSFNGAVSGRLAVDAQPTGYPPGQRLVAAGSVTGQIGIFVDDGTFVSPAIRSGGAIEQYWPITITSPGFEPEFLWIDFDGHGKPAGSTSTCGGGASGRTLVVHYADWLRAYCAGGEALPGWGSAGDTLVAGIGAGDPDGDGYAEVLAQTVHSGVGFWNQSGRPSPGWPKQTTPEGFRTDSPPLATDVNGDGRTDVVAMNGSGILAALDPTGHEPDGWPLATGSGAVGSAVAADLDRDGSIEIVSPDRAVHDSLSSAHRESYPGSSAERSEVNARLGTLYAYSLPSLPAGGAPVASAWTMVGGDPGRTSTLPDDRSPVAAAASSGPYVPGSLKAYPNPARQQPVSLAYQLTEPADVDIRIVDASGHPVASFTSSGRRADNVEVWDPGNTPAGLYLARLRFHGASSEHTETILVGVLR